MVVALAKDARGSGIQVLSPSTTQVLAVGAGSNASTAITASNIVRLISTTDCHLSFGAAPTATGTDMLVTALVPEYFEIETTGDKIAVIQNAAGGSLYITEMI